MWYKSLNSQLQTVQILRNDVQVLILCAFYFITTVTEMKFMKSQNVQCNKAILLFQNRDTLGGMSKYSQILCFLNHFVGDIFRHTNFTTNSMLDFVRLTSVILTTCS